MKPSGHIAVFLVTLLCCSFVCNGQPIYTKDKVFLGYCEDMYLDCLGEDSQNYLYINNRIINIRFFCRCFIDELIPKIRYNELNEALETGQLERLLLQHKYFKAIDPCMKHFAEVENAYAFDKVNTSEQEKQVYIKICFENFYTDDLISEDITSEMILDYCECSINTMIKNGFTYKQIIEMEKEESEAFNEIVVPCMTETMRSIFQPDSGSGYNPDDVYGDILISNVKLTEYFGLGYKIKITIGGGAKYYLFDTGASYLVINSDVEQELFNLGLITNNDYKKSEEVILANNEIIEVRIVELNNIEIGDFTVNNVKAAIIDHGTLLCGNSLLNKFKKWELDTENKQLILYK